MAGLSPTRLRLGNTALLKLFLRWWTQQERNNARHRRAIHERSETRAPARNQGLGTGARNGLFLGAPLMPNIDLSKTPVRELNAALHRLNPATNETLWT